MVLVIVSTKTVAIRARSRMGQVLVLSTNCIFVQVLLLANRQIAVLAELRGTMVQWLAEGLPSAQEFIQVLLVNTAKLG